MWRLILPTEFSNMCNEQCMSILYIYLYKLKFKQRIWLTKATEKHTFWLFVRSETCQLWNHYSSKILMFSIAKKSRIANFNHILCWATGSENPFDFAFKWNAKEHWTQVYEPTCGKFANTAWSNLYSWMACVFHGVIVMFAFFDGLLYHVHFFVFFLSCCCCINWFPLLIQWHTIQTS